MRLQNQDRLFWLLILAFVASTLAGGLVYLITEDAKFGLGGGVLTAVLLLIAIFVYLIRQTSVPKFFVGSGIALLIGVGALTPAVRATLDTLQSSSGDALSWITSFIKYGAERYVRGNLGAIEWAIVTMSFLLVGSGIVLGAKRNKDDSEDQRVVEALLANRQQLLIQNDELRQQVKDAVVSVSDQKLPGAELLVEQAERDLRQGSTAKAKALYHDVARQWESEGEKARRDAALAYRRLGALAFLDKTTEISLSAYRRATELDPDNVDGWNQLGHIYFRLGDYSQAEASYRTILSRHGNDQKVIANTYGNIGKVQQDRRAFEEAVTLHERALEIHLKLGDKLGEAYAYANLGCVHLHRGELDDAETLLNRALEIFVDLDSKLDIAHVLDSLGIVYLNRGNKHSAKGEKEKAVEEMNKALVSHERALTIQSLLGDKVGMAASSLNLGKVLLDSKNPDQALSLFEDALELNTELSRNVGRAIALDNIGLTFQHLGELDAAAEKHQESLAINKELGRKDGMAYNYANLGFLHESSGSPEEAKRVWQLSVDLFDQIGSPVADDIRRNLDNLGV